MVHKIQSFIWKILLVFIFLRPFLSEYVFFIIGFWYIFVFICLSFFYMIISDEKVTLSISKYNFPIFLFMISILISLIYSGLNEWSGLQLYLFFPNILIFYITTILKSEQKRQLIATIFISASIISIYAIYQYLSDFSFINSNEYIAEFIIKKRVFATFLSPNMLASYIIMMLFLGLGLLITAYFQKEKTFPWIFISLFTMSVALLLTKSLGGILAFTVTFILFIFLANLYLLPNINFKKVTLKLNSMGINFVLLFFIFISTLFTRERLSQLFNLNNPNNPMVQRIYYWFTSLKIIKHFPLTGIGWAKLENLYRLYKPAPSVTTSYSHNVFLQIIVELGLLGLLSFIWIVFMFLKAALRSIKDNTTQRALKIGLFCAGCSFLLHNLIDLSFYFGQVSFFWWIILGLFNIE